MCHHGKQEATSLYRLYGIGDRLLYIGITNNFTRRYKEHQEQKPWGRNISHIRIETFSCRSCAESEERRCIRDERPYYNKAHNYDEPIVTSRWRLCLHCKTPTPPYEDAIEDKTWSWTSSYLCEKCAARWMVSWNYPIGDQVIAEEVINKYAH